MRRLWILLILLAMTIPAQAEWSYNPFTGELENIGLSVPTAATTYLKLDCSNDPLTAALDVAPDTDITCTFGRAKIGDVIGGVAPDYAGFSHYDYNTISSYSLLHGPSGESYLNSASGQVTSFRINNTDEMTLSATLLDAQSNDFKTTGTISNLADDSKHVWGVAGATDSYIQFGGTNLEYYSAGAHDFGAGNITTTGSGTFDGGINISDGNIYDDGLGNLSYSSDGTHRFRQNIELFDGTNVNTVIGVDGSAEFNVEHVNVDFSIGGNELQELFKATGFDNSVQFINQAIVFDATTADFKSVNISNTGNITTTGRATLDAITLDATFVTVDPSSTIQATITAIEDATSSKPYVVYVPPGIYTEQITMKDYVSLKGSGMYSTTITWAGAAGDANGTIFPANGVTISDLSILATDTASRGISNQVSADLADDTFTVSNCYIDAEHDVMYLVQDNVTSYVFNCVVKSHDDTFVMYTGSTNSKMYIYNTHVTHTGDTVTYGVFRNTQATSRMYVYNSYVIGDIVDTTHYHYCVVGYVSLYDTDIEWNATTSSSLYAVYASSSTIEIHGGKIRTTNSGAGNEADLVVYGTALTIYGVDYETTGGTGTIKGVGIIDDDMNLYAGDLTTTGQGTFGSVTDGITLNDSASAFHVYGIDTTEYGIIDTGIDFTFVPKPPILSLALVAEAGNVDNGKHTYHVRYTTAIGETDAQAYSTAPDVTTDAGHGKVTVTMPVSADYRVTGRKIYRTLAGGTDYTEYLLATIANNTDTEYEDNISDATILAGGRTYLYAQSNTTNAMILQDGVSALVIGSTATTMGAGAGISGNGVVIGSQAGRDLVAQGLGNTLVGLHAGRTLTTGSSNTFIGYDAGVNADTGAIQMCGIGQTSLQFAKGNSSTAVGHYSGRYNTGNTNTFIGRGSGQGAYPTSTGGNNACLGAYSGTAITTGTNNVFMGYGTGGNITTGTRSTMIGYYVRGTGIDADYSVGIGNVCKVANYSISIGSNSGLYETADYKLFIDSIDRTNEATARTSSIIYGVMSATVADQTLRFNAGISSGTKTITASSDNTDVKGINTLFINPGAAVVIGGFAGGVDGQVLHVVVVDGDQAVTFENEEATGTQKLAMHESSDETITNDRCGFTFVFNSTTGFWHDVSHAKHV